MLTKTLQKRRELFTFFISLMLLALVAVSWIGHHSARIRYFNLVIFSAGGLVWLIIRARSRHPLQIPKFILPIVLLTIYSTIMVLKSPLPYSGLESALMAIFFLLTFFFFIDSLQGSWTVETWEKALIASAIMYAVPEILSFFAWLQKWWTLTGSNWSWPPVGFRISGFFITSANIMAGYLNLVLPLVVVNLLREKQTSRKLLWSLALLLFLIIEYFTSSRGGWISAIVGIGSTLIMLYFKNIRKRLSSGRIKNLVISRRVILGVIIIFVVGGLIGSIFIRQVQKTPGHGPGGSGRIQIWTNAFNVFMKSPVFGNGPESMGILYAIESGIPPGFDPDHAHNLLLQIAGEFGLIGLVLVLCAAGLIALSLFQSWRSSDDTHRPKIAAITGSLLALCTHHLVDYHFGLYQYTIAVLLLLAILAHISPNQQKISIRRYLSIPILGTLLIGYILGFLYALRGITPFQSGVSAAISGDWVTARDRICDAHENNKENSCYAFQCGLANAQVAFFSDDNSALLEALSAQRAGLELDPYWPPHWANLAALEWENGESQLAVAHMEQAFVAAPRNWIFALNLGWMEEQLGQSVSALQHYKVALTLNPFLESSHFYSKTDLRQKALIDYEPIENPSSSDEYALEGWRLLNDGNFSMAEEMLNHALALNSHNGEAYAWLAQFHQEQGNLDEAWKSALLGIFVESDSPIVLIKVSEISQLMGKKEDAASYLLQAYHQTQNLQQSKRYTATLYKRGLLPRDTVPQLVQVVISDDMIGDFTELAELLEIQRDMDEANEVMTWVKKETER